MIVSIMILKSVVKILSKLVEVMDKIVDKIYIFLKIHHVILVMLHNVVYQFLFLRLLAPVHCMFVTVLLLERKDFTNLVIPFVSMDSVMMNNVATLSKLLVQTKTFNVMKEHTKPLAQSVSTVTIMVMSVVKITLAKMQE
jgi:hypothetical protein